MLSEYQEKVKYWFASHASLFYISAVFIAVALGSFGLGRLSVDIPQKEPIRVYERPALSNDSPGALEKETSGGVSAVLSASTTNPSAGGTYVASRGGTAYHYPWCPGALRIKESNKIWFATKADAEKMGYRPAANCDGL